MSSKDNPCRKFQANIFNKSKCQNCFKPRESHLLSDEDLNQAKPIYGGWLLLAPEGTNFGNPLHRSRKWQRRFFILYEHGLLRYALDEMPSTLPQGTINMNQCSDVIDGESRTGQKNSLCVLTPDREHFIRAECREIINGWQEALTVYPRTNKQNQKKKRKVEPPTPQEPGPAKVTVTSSGGSIPCLPSSIASAERVPASRSTLWQEERWSRASTIPCSRSASCLSQLTQSHPGSSVTREDGTSLSGGRKVRVESGYFSLEKTKSPEPPQPPQHQPLTTSTSLGVLHHRYSPCDSPSYPNTSLNYPSSDPLPSPGALLSPSYSTVSSSQSSLDSEPSSNGSWSSRGGAGGNVGGGGGGRVGRPGKDYVVLSNVPRARRLSHREAFRSDKKKVELRARTRSPGREEVARLFGLERRRSQVIGKFESGDGEGVEHMDTTSPSEPPSNTVSVQRQGRSERRSLACKQELYVGHFQEMSLDAEKERRVPDVSCSFNFRRAKSLDRRVTESSMTPDLLNFKKGWMTKLYEDGMWKKHWFVLTDQSLRYYRDSIAEEAADMDGEIDLSTCYDVTEFPVQRNYGFQILSKEGACTLSAMTSGIRRNWIQAIMKNARPTIAPPDVTRSLLEEKARGRVVLHPSPQPGPDPSPESPRVEVRVVKTQRSVDHAPATVATPASEPRKSRVRERRREGRSKTYDWSEFQPGQTEDPKRDKAPDTVDPTSASSSSTSSSSSSTSSLASSPVSTTSSPPTSSSISAPPPGRGSAVATREESEQERGRRREERPQRFQQDTHAPSTVTTTMTATVNAVGAEPRKPGESQDQGRMEVDHPEPGAEGSGESDGRAPDVQVEIEQRWHQVETTPLREEKQVPISTTDACLTERLPPQELAALLDKELGQTQKELARLQEQNNMLQEQLEDARGREHSAREGYVLQSGTSPPSSSPHRAPWQRLHKLNQDLQNDLEAQRRKQDLAQHQVQTLRRSYTDAQDAIGRHEADIQALQAKLSSAMAEILASEQAVARMRNELKLEQERSREQEEEWVRSDATLRVQLRDSEDRLREVEASLLERSQALRHLERQQALQRDHLREVHRLQERLAEVTGRLSATEQGQALKEERLRTEQRSLQESHERERQSLARRLAEAESGRAELEERLLEAEQQVEALLRGMRASDGDEVREEVMRLQEDLAQTTDVAETLRESVCRLEEEKGRLTCRCQELLNQISEADREVTKLRSRLETEEADYYTLEHSYERASEEFQKISRVLQEKEEEIRQTKEMYERLVERKEEDLNEALIKMAALGSSLEETEQRLQAREALLCQMDKGLRGQSEACSAETDLQAKLVVAEDRIAELEQHLNALQLGYADLRMERQRAQEGALHARETTKERGQSSSNSLPTNTDSSLTFDLGSKVKSSSDSDESQAKRQRIRFSSIQCQKYIQSEDLETSNADNTSSDISEEISQEISQDFQLSMETNSSDITFQFCSDPEKFISIITALEIKLLATEEKLRDLTQKLEEQRVDQPEGLMEGHGSWAGTDSELQELNARLEQEEAPSSALPGPVSQITAAKHQYAKALVCVESSREKVRGILSSHCPGSTGLQLHTLSEIENELVSATLYIREGGMTWNEHPSEVTQSPAQEIHKSKASNEETIRLFAKTLSFEAMVLNKMAFLIQNPDSDLLQRLIEICRETETIKRSDGDCVAIVYADVLTRKLMLESAFWAEVEKMESRCELMQGESSDVKSTVASMSLEANVTVIYNTCVKAELSHSLQSLKSFYEDKFKMLKRELAQAHGSLQQRESALKEIIQAPTRLDLTEVLQDVSSEFGFSEEQSLADVSELTPYMEQIEMEEAQDLAEEVVDRHLVGGVPSCSVDSVESLQVGRDNLAAELERQAAILHRFSQAIESGSHPGLANIIQANSSYQSNLNLTGGSLCMREALIQAQVAYVACRLRADHERDLVRYRQAGHSMDVLVQEHACTVGAIRERYEASLQEERQGFTCTMASLQDENQALRGEMGQRVEQLSQQQERLALLEERFHRETEELRQRHQLELSQAEQGRASTELALMETTADSQRKLEVLLVDMDTIEERHEGHLRRLEEQFQGQIRELQQVHQEEIQRLHTHYTETIRSIQDQEDSGSKGDSSPESGHSQSPLPEEVTPSTEQAWPMEEEEQGKGEEGQARVATDPMVVLKDRIQELETQMDTMRDELETKHLEGDVASLREKYQRDFESLKATCERGFTAMEETHHKVVEDLQRQHQREVSKLLEEKERLLAEETAATIAAIEAMKNAHREEMEKNQRSQISGLSTDIDELHEQYQEELQSIQRELEVLSEQYSQKCLENAHLAQALEAERQALRQCQRENQELNAHNQELNNRLTVEITRMRSCYSGETALSPFTQGKDLYELEVLLRIKESEIQYLKQEIHSLKDELQSALRDKKYATDKYKDIYTELSIVKAKADCDITKLTEKLLVATEALGERNVDGSATPGYDIMKSKSNPDFLKKERSTLSKQIRGVRSKSLKEGLTVQERMKLFEAKDSRKI
ncbi:golgin subfamily A member 4 isoform X3 [Oncorhynchus keta]|uniref:golgin subfamily A member 4 isoform X3 n=1 Tax=Oncorhynchus keta TaxID=8018 RepID=UPI0015FAA570|nr:golgin subfamily A member 4 isoform X3 [Oncorhynchus keta]